MLGTPTSEVNTVLPESVIRNASERVIPEPMSLVAGPLTMLFEPSSAFLRHVRFDDAEVLRGIYVAVRDHNWGTVEPNVTNVRLRDAADSFRLTFDVECREGPIHFLWQGMILGDADGTVTFRMDGTACSTFLRNRIGFCVLHPIRECAGKPCTVQTVDGLVSEASFPYHISPHQPMTDLHAITHEVKDGVLAEVRFQGETFEMEDQRNWTDASYKTYCTPLDLPFPVEVREGTQITQSVVLEFSGIEVQEAHRSVVTPSFTRPLCLILRDTPVATLPRIGLGTASHSPPLNRTEFERLGAMRLSHLRVDMLLTDSDYPAQLERASAEAAAVGAKLEIALFVSDAAESELGSLAKHLAELRPNVMHWLIFHVSEKSTSARWVELARECLAEFDPNAVVGAGTNAYFTELNRERPAIESMDLVCYSINPQVHAFDDISLMETLSAQRWTVESTRQFSGDRPIAVTPVTLRPRFNPNATSSEPSTASDALPPQVDVRQMSLLAAAWTLGSIKYLAESGVHSITYYETTGWQGVMERQEGSPAATKFRSIPGAVYPLYHVLADMGELATAEVVSCESSNPLRFDALALRSSRKLHLLLANLTSEEIEIELPWFEETMRCRTLDETTAIQAMVSPEDFRGTEGQMLPPQQGTLLHLRPYATARIDVFEA